jgi:5-methylcytosine-specific restriction endonuclease McrBC regulatory subunit McrC
VWWFNVHVSKFENDVHLLLDKEHYFIWIRLPEKLNIQELFRIREDKNCIDIVVNKLNEGGNECFIIDTKWKVLDTTNPKPSDDDLKQMYAYNLYWDAKRSMLLYPSSDPVDEKFGVYWKGRDKTEANECKVGFVNVLDENNILDLSIGTRILDKLLV